MKKARSSDKFFSFEYETQAFYSKTHFFSIHSSLNSFHFISTSTQNWKLFHLIWYLNRNSNWQLPQHIARYPLHLKWKENTYFWLVELNWMKIKKIRNPETSCNWRETVGILTESLFCKFILLKFSEISSLHVCFCNTLANTLPGKCVFIVIKMFEPK